MALRDYDTKEKGIERIRQLEYRMHRYDPVNKRKAEALIKKIKGMYGL